MAIGPRDKARCPMRKRPLALAALAGILASAAAEPAPRNGVAPVLVGWVERVTIGTSGLVLMAKLDTGADVSSLNGRNLRLQRRGNENWVEFDVVNVAGASEHFERRVVRFSRVKRFGGDQQRRPVVRMSVCLRDHSANVEVNLTDRTGFDYQMLIGRNFLKDRFAVDPSARFTGEPDCGKPPA